MSAEIVHLDDRRPRPAAPSRDTTRERALDAWARFGDVLSTELLLATMESLLLAGRLSEGGVR